MVGRLTRRGPVGHASPMRARVKPSFPERSFPERVAFAGIWVGSASSAVGLLEGFLGDASLFKTIISGGCGIACLTLFVALFLERQETRHERSAEQPGRQTRDSS